MENGQRVYFTASNEQEIALNPPVVTLTVFFTLCQNDVFAKTLIHSEVSTYCTWNAGRKPFERRKCEKRVDEQDVMFKETTIGGLHTVHNNQHEHFYLHMQLVNVPGPTSSRQLRIVNSYTGHFSQCMTNSEFIGERAALGCTH